MSSTENAIPSSLSGSSMSVPFPNIFPIGRNSHCYPDSICCKKDGELSGMQRLKPLLVSFVLLSTVCFCAVGGASNSTDFVAQLFERADADGNGLLDLDELQREYSRNELPLTPGYEFLMARNSLRFYDALSPLFWASK